ncbi:MAG: Uma2 family endonuclease [Dehalococcoidia bacterium]
MPISPQTYEQVALEDHGERWELVCGRLYTRPDMTAKHNELGRELVISIALQVDRRQYVVGDNIRVHVSTDSFYGPDAAVVPRAAVRRQQQERPTRLEVYDDPLPFIAEIWSPSTSDYDVAEKLREYQLRGDAEIWRLHPLERTITAWRRQSDGGYTETLYREGRVPIASLPGVAIEIAELFEEPAR